MRHAAIHENRVTLTGIKRCAVLCFYRHVCVVRQVFFGSRCQVRLQLQPYNTSAWPHHFRHNRSVISNATSQVIHALSRLQPQCVNPTGQRSGLPVVDVLCAVQRNQHVVVYVSRIIHCDVRQLSDAGRGHGSPFCRTNLPRPRPQEFLSRHLRERLHQSRRCRARRKLHLPRIEFPAILDGHHAYPTICRKLVLRYTNL